MPDLGGRSKMPRSRPRLLSSASAAPAVNLLVQRAQGRAFPLVDQLEHLAQAEAQRPAGTGRLHDGQLPLVGPIVDRRGRNAEQLGSLVYIEEPVGEGARGTAAPGVGAAGRGGGVTGRRGTNGHGTTSIPDVARPAVIALSARPARLPSPSSASGGPGRGVVDSQ